MVACFAAGFVSLMIPEPCPRCDRFALVERTSWHDYPGGWHHVNECRHCKALLDCHNGTWKDADPEHLERMAELLAPRTEAPEEPFGERWPGVSRRGDAVLRPHGEPAFRSFALLQHLDQAGFAGAPRAIGNDRTRREMVSFVPGDVPVEPARYGAAQLAAAARLIRAYHDATIGASMRGDAEVVCHGDLRPENTVFRDGVPAALIDFDDIHPGTRLEDLGHAAWHWIGIGDPARTPADVGRDLALFARAYGDVTPSALVDAALAAQEHHGVLVARRRWPDARKVEVTAWAAECMLWLSTHREEVLAAA
jgi:hypothetical protein